MSSIGSLEQYHRIVDQLCLADPDLARVVAMHGYPPLWKRDHSFATLIWIILEQQVSLASAYAAFTRLKDRIGEVTPQLVLSLTDEELRACSFSRQKTSYARALATAILNKAIDLEALRLMPEEEARTQLKQLKGIGDWTVDVFLMMAQQRADHFPLGDIALVNSLRHEKQLDASVAREELLRIADAWRPYRTVAAMILWHAYIQRKGMTIQGY